MTLMYYQKFVTFLLIKVWQSSVWSG